MAVSCYTSIKTRIETSCLPRPKVARSTISCYTSIKTRIETGGTTLPPRTPLYSCYTSIKTRIETKVTNFGKQCGRFSCYTSIKTRIETASFGGVRRHRQHSLATLPSKQGLKRGWVIFPIRRARLLLHFHQNKD